MATTLLPSGTSALSSSPLTINAGESIVLHLKTDAVSYSFASSGFVFIEFQNSDLTFSPVDVMQTPNKLTALITAPSTGPIVMRVFRPAIDAWRPGIGVTQA